MVSLAAGAAPTANGMGWRMSRSTLRRVLLALFLLAALLLPLLVMAAPRGLPAVTVTTTPGGGQSYSLTLQVLILMTAVTLLPGIVLMMTSFTRIIIVLAILRQALGAGQAPPNQVLIGLALFLTLFVMGPVLDRINTEAVQPYMAGTLDATAALDKGLVPLKGFMLNQTRESDIATFVRIAGGKGFEKPEDVPMRILVPAFATSELKSAFQIGFLIFIPFVIIDLVIASVLMSMGMMMLSPVLISLPFKLMLFVLVDGWGLIMATLAASFYS
jgi:flagellar biosynthetic protein FliP